MGIHGDVPVMLFDAPIHARQAETGPLADFLGGKKRFENTVFCHLAHAGPGVFDYDSYIRTLDYLKMFIRQCVFVQIHGFRGYA